MGLIQHLLRRSEFESEPPVLFDIGASGGVHPAWRRLAKYSICVAFDPDDREMGVTRKKSSAYRECHVFNRAVTCGSEAKSVFHLTKAPACSSVLLPHIKELANWEFADRFTIVDQRVVETIHVRAALEELGLNRVDWFKTDSQGTDLRLFLALGEPIVSKVLVTEFEPGIIDAYEGEDKLWNVLQRMDELGFWMSDMLIKGSSRIKKSVLSGLSRIEKDYLVHLHRTSPGWAEVKYVNSMLGEQFTKRDYLLSWICAVLGRQYGFAMEVARLGQERFSDPIFMELEQHCIRNIRCSYLNAIAYLPILRRLLRKTRKLGTVDVGYLAEVKSRKGNFSW
jgi:FkbM family methyltransferase